MSKLEIAVAVLAGIGILGLAWLIYTEKEIIVFAPIVSALVGWLIGKKQLIEAGAVKMFGKKK